MEPAGGASGSLWEDGLLLAETASSVLLCSACLLGSSRRPLLAAFLLTTALDSLQLQASLFGSHRCGLFTHIAHLFLFLQLGFLASLAAMSCHRFPLYLHLVLPPCVSFLVYTPFMFPQVATPRYFYNRQMCGFSALSVGHAIVTMIFAFVFPLSTLYYFSIRNFCPVYGRLTTRDEKHVIVVTSICSVLLIPHIIEINIAHFSISLLKYPSDNDIVYTDIFDTLFIWLRRVFNVITPSVMLYILKEIREDWRQLYLLCCRKYSVAKYIKTKTNSKVIYAEMDSPVLFSTEEGLRVRINSVTKVADTPYDCDALKEESSTSTITPESSKVSQDKHVFNKKKIVRFAHSVKEISMKNDWDYGE